jgi:hypothetical protein
MPSLDLDVKKAKFHIMALLILSLTHIIHIFVFKLANFMVESQFDNFIAILFNLKY